METRQKIEKDKRSMAVPRSADERITSLKGVIDTTNRNTIILIRILSKESWTAYELSLLVLNYSYDSHGLSGDELASKLWDKLFYFKRRYPGMLFNIWKKEWFVINSAADPKIRDTMTLRREAFGPVAKKGQRRLRGERSLRDLIVEILSERGPLEQRDLVFAVKKHPDYYGMYPDHIALRKAINSALRNGSRKKRYRRLFKRYDSNLSSVNKWNVISEIDPPPIDSRPQAEAIILLMDSFGRKKYWSIAELAKLAMQPGSGYSFSLDATKYSVMENISQCLRRYKGNFFEKIGVSSNARWRLKKREHIAKISLDDRFRAIDLLAKGITLSHLVEKLSIKHPGLNWGIIRRIYDPPHGPFSITRLEGASDKTIELAKMGMLEACKHLSLIAQNRKRSDSLAQNHNSRRLRLLDELTSAGIEIVSKSRRGWLQLGDVRDPESLNIMWENSLIVIDVLRKSLNDFERQIIDAIFFDGLTIANIAEKLTQDEEEISWLVSSVLKRLSTYKQLEELL